MNRTTAIVVGPWQRHKASPTPFHLPPTDKGKTKAKAKTAIANAETQGVLSYQKAKEFSTTPRWFFGLGTMKLMGHGVGNDVKRCDDDVNMNFEAI